MREEVCLRHLCAVLAICVGTMATAVASDDGVANVDDQMQGAQRVVVARARAVSGRWSQNPYGDRLIVSRVLLDVEETLKGAPESTVSLDIVGGTVDGVTLRVSSSAVFEPGDRAVLFLDEQQPGVATPHRKGASVLKLDSGDRVRGIGLSLNEIRASARRASTKGGAR